MSCCQQKLCICTHKHEKFPINQIPNTEKTTRLNNHGKYCKQHTLLVLHYRLLSSWWSLLILWSNLVLKPSALLANALINSSQWSSNIPTLVTFKRNDTSFVISSWLKKLRWHWHQNLSRIQCSLWRFGRTWKSCRNTCMLACVPTAFLVLSNFH